MPKVITACYIITLHSTFGYWTLLTTPSFLSRYESLITDEPTLNDLLVSSGIWVNVCNYVNYCSGDQETCDNQYQVHMTVTCSIYIRVYQTFCCWYQGYGTMGNLDKEESGISITLITSLNII